MVNEERLRPMIKMAIFDKREGKNCKPMIEYTRSDYVALELMKSFISGSIAFCLMFALWAIEDIDRALGMLSASRLMGFVVAVGLRYVIFLCIYLLITYVVYQIRYTEGRKKVKTYYASLKEIRKIYEREEKIRIKTEDE